LYPGERKQTIMKIKIPGNMLTIDNPLQTQ
jgi:hypothetical protein